MFQKLSLLLFCLGVGLRFSGGTIPFLSPIVFIFLAVVVELLSRRNPLKSFRIPGRSLFFLLFLVLSLVYSHSVNYGIVKSSVLVFWILSFSVMSDNILKNFKLFLKFLCLSLVLILLLFYYNFGSPFELLNKVYTYFRLHDDQTNPNSYSRFLGLGIIAVILVQKYFRNKFFRLGLHFIAVIALLYMFLSGSKGPLLSLMVSLFLYFFLFKGKKYRIGISLVVFLSAVVISGDAFFSSSHTLTDFVTERFINYEGSFEGRNERYDVFFSRLEIAAVKNIFILLGGNGIGSFSYFFDGKDIRSYPHNIFMEIIFELGFVGLLLFLSIVLLPVVKLWKTGIFKIDDRQKFLFVLWVYTFITAQFSSDISGNFLLFGFSILLINLSAMLTDGIKSSFFKKSAL